MQGTEHWVGQLSQQATTLTTIFIIIRNIQLHNHTVTMADRTGYLCLCARCKFQKKTSKSKKPENGDNPEYKDNPKKEEDPRNEEDPKN